MKKFFDEKLINETLVAVAVNFIREETWLIEEFVKVARLDRDMSRDDDSNIDSTVYIFKYATLNKVDTYPLPKTLQEKLKNTIRYMDLQLVDWINFNVDLIPLDTNIFSQALQWTNRGKVDVLKTVNNIVNNEDVSIYYRFLLSCRFCVEEKVGVLWENLSFDFRREFLYYLDPQNLFWIYYLRAQIHPSESFSQIIIPDENTYEEIVVNSIESKNYLTLKYFWGRLSLPTKIRCCSTIKNMNDDLFQFFQSQPELHQETFLRENIFFELEASLNNWLWQEDLESQLESCKPFLSDTNVECIFTSVINILGLYPVRDKLQHLVALVWRMFSLKDKDLIHHLHSLLMIEEFHIFLTLMKELSPATIHAFLQSYSYSMKRMIVKDKEVFVLENLIKLVCNTEEEVVKFKQDYLYE